MGLWWCVLGAVGVLDGVFLQTPYRNDDYAARREQALIIAVNCTAPSATCFCPSMGSGPGAQGGFDLALTEVVGEGEHWFLVAAGSPRGRALLTDLPLGLANRTALAAVEGLLERATAQITRHLDRAGLGKRLQENPLHPHWENVAARCLACGNCTSVCPTCFCTTTEEQISLDGRVSERLQRWDSCFSAEFSELGGIPVRQSTQSRYRQWLTHKLSSWIDQFGCSGCVGCGRCITWCPVGIDLTAEAQALRQSEPTAGENHGGS
ncbi:MAG: 4Fe-4S dicluster domain-containing protein [Candidatus Competibacterales bacterium]